MATAIFGINNSGLNLVVNLFALMLVVLWLALIVYTYLDAKRRIADPFLVGCATIASFIPYLGTAVYAIVRPPEFLEDAHERGLEIKAAELRVRQLKELSCPGCTYPVEKNFLRCPRCQRRLKDPCPSCGKPVDPRWALCPFCETALPEREGQQRPPRSSEGRRAREERATGRKREEEGPAGSREEKPAPKRQPVRKKPAAPGEKKPPAHSSSKQPSNQKQTQRSQSREPDPDPRQA